MGLETNIQVQDNASWNISHGREDMPSFRCRAEHVFLSPRGACNKLQAQAVEEKFTLLA